MTKEAETLTKRPRRYCRVRKFLNVLHAWTPDGKDVNNTTRVPKEGKKKQHGDNNEAAAK
jgi:hypothetical protein